MAVKSRRHPSLAPAHPGELLREIMIPATGLAKAEVARLLGISRQHLYDIMAEKKPVTPETAVRLGKLFGDGPGIWLRMQSEFDLWHAARKVDTSQIPTLKAA
jgi:addiction module HigA family antidote